MSVILTEVQIPKDAKFGLFSLVHGDRLGSIIGRFAIDSQFSAVSIAAMLSFSAALVAVFEGSLLNRDLNLDLAHDIGWWNQFLLAFHTLIYIAGSYFGAFPRTLRQLVDSGVLLASDEDWKKVRRFTKAKLTNTSFVLLPYVAGVTAAALTSNVLQANGTWYASDQYLACYLIPVYAFILYFFMTFLSLRLYSAFLILKMLFGFSMNIQPFHPDSCGGLGSLMEQSAKLYWAMIVFGVVAALGIFSNVLVYGQELLSLYNFLLVLSYILLTGIAFFLPLYALTDSMRDAKRKILLSIKERYRALNRRQGSGANSLDALSDDQIADLRALKALQ